MKRLAVEGWPNRITNVKECDACEVEKRNIADNKNIF